MILEPICPPQIVGLLKRMLAAVDFNHKTGTGCQEIHDIGPKSNLTPKFDSLELTIAQPTPKPTLGIRRSPPQLACPPEGHERDDTTD
jgi:hypothetical protein